MKTVYRIIGFAVVLIVLVAALLYFLNEKGVLRGPISNWINGIKADIMHMFGQTKDLVNDIKDSDTPIQDNVNIPIDPKKEGTNPESTPEMQP